MKNQPQEIHSIGAVARMREQAMGNGSVHDANAHPLGGGDGQLAVDAKAQAALIWACMKKRAAQMGMRLRLADGRVITPELSPEEVELEDDAAKAKLGMYASYQPGSALIKQAGEDAPPAAKAPKPEEHVAALALGRELRQQERTHAVLRQQALQRVGSVTARPPLVRKAK